MRFLLEGTPEELKAKSSELLSRLATSFKNVDPSLSKSLQAIIPEKSEKMNHRVLQEISEKTQDAYEDHMDRMLEEISKVLWLSATSNSGIMKKADHLIEWVDEDLLKASGWASLDEVSGDLLWKAQSHKYIKRVPYTGADGKQKYRYYYQESAIGREAQVGEDIRLGQHHAHVSAIDNEGTITLREGEDQKERKVAKHEWKDLMVEHYGGAYFSHAEKRAQQVVNAISRHVPLETLKGLQGETDEQRMADLAARGPEIHAKLEKAFSRAGISPWHAKDIIADSLSRRGWTSEARATIIGSILTPEGAELAKSHKQISRAAENLAGGQDVEAKHAAAAIDLRKSRWAGDNFGDQAVSIAKAAENDLGKLQDLITQAQGGGYDSGKAGLLAQALAYTSATIQKLALLTKAYPGLQDRAVDQIQALLPSVPSVAPRAEPTAYGGAANLYVAGEGGQPKAMKAKYKLVEASSLIPSHDPMSFGVNEAYPASIQERAYHRDKDEQAKVIRNSTRMNGAFVANTNPDAVNGPPIVTKEGWVLGGNSRTMSMVRTYKLPENSEKAKELKQYLTDHAHEMGFQAQDVTALEHPVLVREIEDIPDKSPRNLRLLVRQMNESFTQGMDPRVMQVALGRKLSDKDLNTLAADMREDETVSDFLASSRAMPFIGALSAAGIIDERNGNQYFQRGSRPGTRRLNEDGRTLINRILVGNVIDNADLLSDTRPQLMEAVASAIPSIIQARANGVGFDLSKEVPLAMDAYNKLQARVEDGTIQTMSPTMDDATLKRTYSYLDDMFQGTHPALKNDRAKIMLEVFIRHGGSPRKFTRVFKEFAKLAKGNPEGQHMHGAVGQQLTPDQVFRHSLVAAVNKEAQEEAVARAQAAEEARVKAAKEEGKGLGLFEGKKKAPKAKKEEEFDIPEELLAGGQPPATEQAGLFGKSRTPVNSDILSEFRGYGFTSEVLNKNWMDALSELEELKKADDVTPVGGITPGGYLKVSDDPNTYKEVSPGQAAGGATPEPEAQPEAGQQEAEKQEPPQVMQDEEDDATPYSDDIVVEKLVQLGDRLYETQAMDPKTKDDSRFSRFDMQVWHRVSANGDIWAMRGLLAKYKRQIGENYYKKLGLDQSPPAAGVRPKYDRFSGDLLLPVDGRINGKDDFRKYLDIQKKFGARFKGQDKCWFVSKWDLEKFDFDGYRKAMSALGLDVSAPAGEPHKPKEKVAGTENAVLDSKDSPEEKPLTAAEAIRGIERKQLRDTIVAYKKENGLYAFLSTFSKKFNDIFSNTSGVLTGITRYNPEDHARETHELELAEEAIEKLKAKMPDFRIVVDDALKQDRHARDRYQAELQLPIPEIQEIIDPAITLYPYQNEGVRFLDKTGGNALIGDEMGLGKYQPIHTLTLTPSGWRKLGDIKIGDDVIGRDGKATKVTGVFPQGVKAVYRLHFSDGSSVEAGDEHLWVMAYRCGGKRWQELLLTTEQIRKGAVVDSLAGNKLDLSKTELYLPMLSAPVEFSANVELPIPAYTLGQLISNGALSRGHAVISTNSVDTEEIRLHLLSEDMRISLYGTYGNCTRISVLGISEKISQLELNVLSKEKFIPRPYLFARSSDRISLLQGLMDGDGSCSKDRNKLVYHTISLRLAENMVELVEGLGGIASIRAYDRAEEEKPVEYQVRIRVPFGVAPFSIKRKAHRYQPGSHAQPRRVFQYAIQSPDAESVCIQVDSPEHLYVTEHCILTHNTLQALAWSAMRKKKVVVVCPKVVRRTWLEEGKKFFPGYFKGQELVSASLRRGDKPDLSGLNLVTVNYESLHKFLPYLKEAGFDTMVVDESHRIKGEKTKQTKSVQELAGLVKHHILLSGTAIKNKREELFTQLGVAAPGKFSKQKIKGSTIGGLWQDMRDHYIARQKTKVLKDLPEKSTSIVRNDVEDLPDIEPSMQIGDLAKLRGQVAMGKLPATKDLADEILESSDSRILIFTESVEAAKSLAEKWGDLAILHHGGMSDEARESAKKEWQRKDEKGEFVTPKRVFVSTRPSLAVGATLTAGDKVIFNDLPWTAADISQAEDRVHRISQRNAVNVYWVTANNNQFDSNVADIIRRKYELGKKSNQGKQLSEAEREWINKPLSWNEILSQIQGKTAGPKADEESPKTVEQAIEPEPSAPPPEKLAQEAPKPEPAPEPEPVIPEPTPAAAPPEAPAKRGPGRPRKPTAQLDLFGKGEDLTKFYDFTEPAREDHEETFERVKRILKQRYGYTERDFTEGGRLYGESSHELLDRILEDQHGAP